ncbi:MAG: hypothetical protein KBG20_05535 [Caldilineaceae bacterium]|nr:hypothetical protein [Caldilineaceae bacterium]MBP8106688.1 hypothetical protein [Caldilineaceae bacterium]MBP8122172.1 hypothetical protein [Caldilineaceae bacterium]MBP9071739.1 hypothetical protein [Caldilineaceae bacterium]
MEFDSAHKRKLSAPSADFLLGIEARLHSTPWRPLAAWSVLAAGLTLGILTGRTGSALGLAPWPTLMLCGLLADGLWGGIWRGLTALPTQGGTGSDPQAAQAAGRWLPYVQPGSPAARLLGRDHAGGFVQNLRVALPVILAALVLATVLGPGALILTGAMILLASLAWLTAHHRSVVALPLSIGATVLLPWALVLFTLTGNGGETDNRAWLLAFLWTLHLWGASRRGVNGPDRLGLGLMALATVGVAGLLIQAQTVIGLAVLAALWLPAWLWTVQGSHPQRISLLWTLSMLASAIALGNGL